MTVNYEPLSTCADCCFASIEAALSQIGEEAKHVSSDVYVSDKWSPEDVRKFRDYLLEQGCLANRVRIDRNLRPFEWYVECCGTRVGCNPPCP